MQQSQEIQAGPGKYLLHDVVNKLTAIICHCDILQTSDRTSESPSRLQKIRDLAEVASLMIYACSPDAQAVNRILALRQQALTSELHAKRPSQSGPAVVADPLHSSSVVQEMVSEVRL